MDVNEPRRQIIDRFDWLITLAAFAASLLLYVRTLVPGVVPNDSAEFQVLAYVVDHAHTTGYHIYTLLAKLFITIVPLGDVAYRVNLFSAFCGSLTIGLVYLSGRVLSGSRWGGLAGALALAISATYWSQSIIAEVYTAGCVFTSAILLLVLAWRQTENHRLLFVAGFLGALAIGVHGSNSLFAPAIMLLLLLHKGELRSAWKPAVAGVLCGLILFLAVFVMVDARENNAGIIQSVYQPSISRWDLQPEYLDSITGRFSFLVFAQQWRSAMFSNPGAVIPKNLWNYLETLWGDFSLLGLLLIPIGFASLYRRDRTLFFFYLAAIFVHHLYTFNYNIGDIYVFFLSGYVYLATLMAEGIADLLRYADREPQRVRNIAVPALAAVLLALTIWPHFSDRIDPLQKGEIRFRVNYLPSNQELEGWSDRIRASAAALPDDAVVLMDWSDLYAYYYAAQIEQGRPDLLFMEAYPFAAKDRMADSMFDFLREKIESGHPVYTVREINELRRGGFNYSSVPVGPTRMYSVEIR